MSTYFKPLRRKIGVMTLVTACLFLGGWVRSYLVRDDLICELQNRTHGLASASGSLRWAKVRQNRPFEKFRLNWGSEKILDTTDHESYWERWPPQWNWGFAGFDFGAGKSRDDEIKTIERWVVPYWSIVTPLTVLSAWLLLSKPRAKTTAKSTPIRPS